MTRRYLPDLPHTGVDDGSCAASIRRAGGVFDELLGLKRRYGKRENPDTVHLDGRHGQLQPTGDVEIPGPLDPGEGIFEGLQYVVVVNLDGRVCHSSP